MNGGATTANTFTSLKANFKESYPKKEHEVTGNKKQRKRFEKLQNYLKSK
jgi:hypothetical protein